MPREQTTPAVLANGGLVLAASAALLASGLAGSVGSLLRFLILVVVLVWVPGAILLDLARVRARVLDDLALSLVAGTAAAAAAYWLTARMGARSLFFLWPAGCVAGACWGWRRQVERFVGLGTALRRWATLAALALLALSLAPYTFLPLFYSNLAPLPDGGLTFYHLPDLVLHASVAQEVSHAIPPAVPFLPGHTASYHYTMDLLPAVFGVGGVALADGCVRLVPTLLTVTTVLCVYALSRDWLGSTGGAALAALLTVVGEDFSWIPGGLLGQGVPWAAAYFGMPTTASLYMLNPMLPALGVLAAVLLCLRYWLRGEKGAWLVLGAGLVVVLAQYKVFTAVHLLAGLGLAGVFAWIRGRDRRLLAFVALAGALLLPSAFFLWSGGAPTRVQLLLQPWPYIPGFLARVGLWDSPWLAPLRAAQAGSFDALGLAQYFFIGVLGYLIGSMGVRCLALPSVLRAGKEDPLRLAVAVFVLLGPLLTLTCAVVVPGLPPSQQYNNAVWFYVQAKYLMWLFVVEVLRRWTVSLAPAAKTLVWGLAVAASLASGLQYFGYQLAVREQARLSPALMEVIHALRNGARAGDVVWAREYVTEPAVSLAPVHGLSLDVFPYLVLDAAAIGRGRAEQGGFWARWQRGQLDTGPLARWKVRYVVADRLDGPAPPAAPSGPSLRPLLENHEFVLYEVEPAGGG